MNRSQKVLLWISLSILILFVGSRQLIHVLTEFLWFESLDLEQVFQTRLVWKILLWLCTFAVYGLWGVISYRIASHLTREDSFSFVNGRAQAEQSRRLIPLLAYGVIVAGALFLSESVTSQWLVPLQFLNASPFDVTDPIFEQDLGFYLFQLPFYSFALTWLSSGLWLGLLVSLGMYVLKGRVDPAQGWTQLITGGPRRHLLLQLAVLALWMAVGYWLDRYDLLYSSDGIVFGAGFTDAHARLFALSSQAILAVGVALVLLGSCFQMGLKLPIAAGVIFILLSVSLGGIFPWLQQQWVVAPNELDRERPYIENSLAFTRRAYRLDEIESRDFSAQGTLTQATLERNQGTVRNIRLWDYRPLLRTYQQLQEIRLYYRFSDVDIDRYSFDGDYSEVMLSAREMALSQLPDRAQTWVNQRLKYTHGYGLVMSPVNQVTPNGQPQLVVRDIPPESTVDLPIAKPALYYGEETRTPILTQTTTDEFDYPQGDRNVSTRYQGTGGVQLSAFWKRLAYAYDQSSLNLLISSYITDESRIHYHRQILNRVDTIAPFLEYDRDPYLAVVQGRLKWIVDAYTVSSRYPYSEPFGLSVSTFGSLSDLGRSALSPRINYIRNSVKVTIDAFDGNPQFWVIDPDDPVLQTYQGIFPDLFESSAAIPPELNAHFRYPLDLFQIQSYMFLAYHMNDPEVFYNQEDLWRFPSEFYEGNARQMEPYYLIMSLPQEEREEFVLILPFTPSNKENMIAWMAARSDREHYGELVLYEFPKQDLIYGPSQIEARIDQTPEISQQLTLWSQEGSRVIRGNLLVIPIEEALLYVEPVYLRAEQAELPELKRVIVAYQNQIAMQPTLDQALQQIFPGETETPSESEPQVDRPESDIPSELEDLVDAALDTYQQAHLQLREGNWDRYGDLQDELEAILQQIDQRMADPQPGQD